MSEEKSVRQFTWSAFPNSSGVSKFLRLGERFQKAPFWRRSTSVDGRPNRSRKRLESSVSKFLRRRVNATTPLKGQKVITIWNIATHFLFTSYFVKRRRHARFVCSSLRMKSRRICPNRSVLRHVIKIYTRTLSLAKGPLQTVVLSSPTSLFAHFYTNTPQALHKVPRKDIAQSRHGLRKDLKQGAIQTCITWFLLPCPHQML